MGRLFLMHLDGNAYSCKFCRTHLGLAADIISKVPFLPVPANPPSLFVVVLPEGAIDGGCDSDVTCFRFPCSRSIPSTARRTSSTGCKCPLLSALICSSI